MSQPETERDAEHMCRKVAVLSVFFFFMLHSLVSLSFSSSKRKNETRQASFRRQTQLSSDKIIHFAATKPTLQQQIINFSLTKPTLQQRTHPLCTDKIVNFAATKPTLRYQKHKLCSDKINTDMSKSCLPFWQRQMICCC